MSRDYKIYHRYLAFRQKISNVSVSTSETTGSGNFTGVDSTISINPNYRIPENEEIEVIFKNKYPVQYSTVRKKFDKKLKKLLRAIEGDDPKQ